MREIAPQVSEIVAVDDENKANWSCLKIKENTFIYFMGDNGTASQYAARGTIKGKSLSGKKGSMLECGALVPNIAYWPGVISPGQVTNTLMDASDLLPTFADIAGAKLPTKNVLDGRSFSPQLLGKKGNPRDWIFIELGNKWYVRDAKWKLNRANELYDMSNAPFDEKLVLASSDNAESAAERKKLTEILAQLNPAGGILDEGDGSGRHGNKKDKKEKKDKPEKKEKKEDEAE
jgi:arylsulfatase A